MLTDTYTAPAFFEDFISDPERALRWDVLRQDSGDPYDFLKKAKEAWRTVERKAGIAREDGAIGAGKRVIFSDGLDVKTATTLQKACDEVGIGGESAWHTAPRSTIDPFRLLWYRHILDERFPKSLRPGSVIKTIKYRDQTQYDRW